MTKKSRTGEYILDGMVYFLGCAVYAVAVNCFAAPNNIAIGGVTGIATILHHLTGFPIGMTVIALNIPLFVAGTLSVGTRFIKNTLLATFFSALLIDGTAGFMPQYTEDTLLAALYGGVMCGAGLGLVFLRGGSTGGTDILAKIILKYRPHMSMGRIILLMDFVVVIWSALAYHEISAGLYAIITIFTTSRVIDALLYGSDKGELLFIITAQGSEIARLINSQFKRGVTVLRAVGAYSGLEKQVLLCAVRKNQTAKLKILIRQTDPLSFVIVSEADTILGEGFNLNATK